MKKADPLASKTEAASLWNSIETYLRNLPPEVLGVRKMDSLEIHKMIPGSYNLNFHISVDKKGFIFRINIDQQSGLSRQVEYEYNILKFLEGHQIAPTVYHIDDTRDHFKFGILIEEYLQGSHLSLETSQLRDVAGLLAKLHSLHPQGMEFITWQDPLKGTYHFVQKDLAHYKTRKTAEKKIIAISERILEKTRLQILKSDLHFQADSLNHTDVGCDNFIKTPEGLRIIDWEKPRVDDCSYDLSCFLSEAAQLWCSTHVLKPEERETFIEEYARFSNKNTELLREKVCLREPMVSLHWVLWGAIKLCDLREDRTTPALLESHEEKLSRYQRIARVENVEKFLDS